MEPRVLSDLGIMQLKPGMHTKRHGMEVMDHHMDNIKKEMIYLYPPVPILMEILLPNRAVSFIFTFLCIIFLYCTWLLSVLTLLLTFEPLECSCAHIFNLHRGCLGETGSGQRSSDMTWRNGVTMQQHRLFPHFGWSNEPKRHAEIWQLGLN